MVEKWFFLQFDFYKSKIEKKSYIINMICIWIDDGKSDFFSLLILDEDTTLIGLLLPSSYILRKKIFKNEIVWKGVKYKRWTRPILCCQRQLQTESERVSSLAGRLQRKDRPGFANRPGCYCLRLFVRFCRCRRSSDSWVFVAATRSCGYGEQWQTWYVPMHAQGNPYWLT